MKKKAAAPHAAVVIHDLSQAVAALQASAELGRRVALWSAAGAGIKEVCFSGPAQVAERLADIAGKWRARLHRRRPNALDLLDEADPSMACRRYLAEN